MRKRRTVLWLFQEDYEYLSNVAENDSDTKNVSMRRLLKAFRQAGITSFTHIDERIISRTHRDESRVRQKAVSW